MKNIFKFFLAVMIGIGVIANASEPQAGKDYVVLDNPIPNQEGTLIKVFSYSCPFCYKYDKSVVKPVMAKLPDTKFVPFHLSTKGAFGNQASEILATMIALDEKNGTNLLDDKSYFKRVKLALYKAYHDDKERWGDDASDPKNVEAFYKTALSAVDMDKATYDKAKEDPRVKQLLDEWGGANGPAYNIAKIQGVPAFVVDGKYLLFTKSITSIDQMADNIKYLHNLK